ncbi:hypothetical protein KHS38_19890 [Mucilaginibacter sp. Bleaf8]|uniref:hypothetical protein n=1 Tax=Mucilaginibacter sp. Bleaf8 TaxID=2834430 RepID=UPI001BCB5A6F|nr:hypothetical protein [Mucilaginibacter sp. Bleaf8]MBS7566677.1 hypothetical protein [Mucilaginibacter sp. Bleaf8]
MERVDSYEVGCKVFVSSDGITDELKISIYRLEVNVYNIKVSLNVGAAVESHSNIYQVNISDHSSCINAFSKIGRDFHLRIPHNSQATISSSQSIPYHEVLLDNLDSGMLYGYGDPAIIRTQYKGSDLYYLLSTSNDAPNAFPILRSEDLKQWTFSG